MLEQKVRTVLPYPIIGNVIVVAIILLRHYLSESKKESRNNKFRFNYNPNNPNNYNVCPKCDINTVSLQNII
jgi:hypothetical protein